MNVRGLVVAPGMELPCAILDISDSGLRLRLSRNLALPPRVIVVEIATGTAHEGVVARHDGHEVGLMQRTQASLRGLAPQRLTQAREAWMRAGGR